MRKTTPIHYCENPETGSIKAGCARCRKRRTEDLASGAEKKFEHQTHSQLGEDRHTPDEVLVAAAIKSNLSKGNYGKCQSCGAVFNPRATVVCPLCRREA
jgi:rubrerythrin